MVFPNGYVWCSLLLCLVFNTDNFIFGRHWFKWIIPYWGDIDLLNSILCYLHFRIFFLPKIINPFCIQILKKRLAWLRLVASSKISQSLQFPSVIYQTCALWFDAAMEGKNFPPISYPFFWHQSHLNNLYLFSSLFKSFIVQIFRIVTIFEFWDFFHGETLNQSSQLRKSRLSSYFPPLW